MTEKEVLESTYVDCLAVYRRQRIKDADTKQTVQREVCIAEGIPCALSLDKAAGVSFSSGVGKAGGGYTLFCSPGAVFQAGDKLVITTCAGQIFTLFSGKPFDYVSHRETPLMEEERT